MRNDLPLSGKFSGNGEFEGDFNNPTSISGSLSAKIKDFSLKKTTIKDFVVPAVAVSKGTIEASIIKGELKFKTFEIGKKDEDLHLLVDGIIRLGRSVQYSQADMVVRLKFSDKLKKELELYTPFITQFLKDDGYYAFLIKGRLSGGFPYPVPVP